MHALKAWFTVHGDEHIPLEAVKGLKKALDYVDLPGDALPAAREFLDHAGTNTDSVYPDLPNLSKHVKQKYG